MTSDDLATLRAILATAKPDAIIEALPVRVLRVLMAAYDARPERDGLEGRGA